MCVKDSIVPPFYSAYVRDVIEIIEQNGALRPALLFSVSEWCLHTRPTRLLTFSTGARSCARV